MTARCMSMHPAVFCVWRADFVGASRGSADVVEGQVTDQRSSLSGLRPGVSVTSWRPPFDVPERSTP